MGVDEEAPPPALMTINDLLSTIELNEYIITIDELESEIDGLNGEIDALNDDVNSLEGEIGSLNKEIEDKDAQLEAKKEREAKILAESKATNNSGGGNSSGPSSAKAEKTSGVDSNTIASAKGQTFEMTYYGMDCSGCTGVTASGLNVSNGATSYNGMKILAADTTILPLHTVVRVTNNDGSSYTGIVKDRGGAIKGNKIDVLVGSEAESSKYGRHSAKVEVISYGDNSYRRE